MKSWKWYVPVFMQLTGAWGSGPVRLLRAEADHPSVIQLRKTDEDDWVLGLAVAAQPAENDSQSLYNG
jgi:hypothetical protein